VLNGEQKFSREAAKGCENISEREGEGTNPALTGSVPSKEVEKGTLGETLPAAIGPLAPADCWKKRNVKRLLTHRKNLSRTQCAMCSRTQRALPQEAPLARRVTKLSAPSLASLNPLCSPARSGFCAT